jgi:Transposase DDE domain group 1
MQRHSGPLTGKTGQQGTNTSVQRTSHDFTVNQAWLTAAMTAQILLCWLKLIAMNSDLARAEPKTLRYRVLNAAARLVRGGRRRRWKIPANWSWAEAITRAWQRITALPDTG